MLTVCRESLLKHVGREAPAWAFEVAAADGDLDAAETFARVFEFGAGDAEVGDAEFAEEQGGEHVDVVAIGDDVEAPAEVHEAEGEALEVAALGVDLGLAGGEIGGEGFEFGCGDVEDGAGDDEVKDDEGGDEEGGGEGSHGPQYVIYSDSESDSSEGVASRGWRTTCFIGQLLRKQRSPSMWMRSVGRITLQLSQRVP